MIAKTKKELVELFNSLDDDVEIEFNVVSRRFEKGKLKKIGFSFAQHYLTENIWQFQIFFILLQY